MIANILVPLGLGMGMGAAVTHAHNLWHTPWAKAYKIYYVVAFLTMLAADIAFIVHR